MTAQTKKTIDDIRAWAAPFLTTALIAVVSIMGNNAMHKLEEIQAAQSLAASSIRLNDLRLSILERAVITLQLDNSDFRLFRERMDVIRSEQEKNHRQ